jgi:hypothetical protein
MVERLLKKTIYYINHKNEHGIFAGVLVTLALVMISNYQHYSRPRWVRFPGRELD